MEETLEVCHVSAGLRRRNFTLLLRLYRVVHMSSDCDFELGAAFLAFMFRLFLLCFTLAADAFRIKLMPFTRCSHRVLRCVLDLDELCFTCFRVLFQLFQFVCCHLGHWLQFWLVMHVHALHVAVLDLRFGLVVHAAFHVIFTMLMDSAMHSNLVWIFAYGYLDKWVMDYG